MDEIWLVMNIVWEIALGVWPLLAIGAAAWLVLMAVSWRRPVSQWRGALPPGHGGRRGRRGDRLCGGADGDTFFAAGAGLLGRLPFVEHQELMTDGDAQRGIHRPETLQDVVPEVNRRLAQKRLSKSDVVVLICRSGDRSSRGANRLAGDSDTQVCSVVDGFEGDMGKDGRRSVNGWKNAGLPWSYKLARERMDFPR